MQTHLPEHIAIVMDGNGRWAKKRFMPRVAGHKAGIDAARNIVKQCAKLNIKVLSLFAFSSENWRRPSDEVNHLMGLFLSGLEREASMLHEHNVRLRFIGDRTRLSASLVTKINEVEQLTRANIGLTLVIAVDYGGRWDICQATNRLINDVQLGLIGPHVAESDITQRLSFADLPDPDLFIRTSGEYRISNFMLWQLAYAELYFTEVLWPDFNELELEKAIASFSSRERRFGLSGEQVKEIA